MLMQCEGGLGVAGCADTFVRGQRDHFLSADAGSHDIQRGVFCGHCLGPHGWPPALLRAGVAAGRARRLLRRWAVRMTPRSGPRRPGRCCPGRAAGSIAGQGWPGRPALALALDHQKQGSVICATRAQSDCFIKSAEACRSREGSSQRISLCHSIYGIHSHLARTYVELWPYC